MDESIRNQKPSRPAMLADPVQSTPQRPPHSLGPVFVRSELADSGRVRRQAIVVLLACTAVLGVSLWLLPSDAGFGTHEQLGVARCSWPANWGIPCPTCGMTTAFANAVRGRWLAGFEAQPLGLLLALATMVLLVLSVRTLMTGRAWRVNWYRVSPTYMVSIVVSLALVSWIYKILAMLPNS